MLSALTGFAVKVAAAVATAAFDVVAAAVAAAVSAAVAAVVSVNDCSVVVEFGFVYDAAVAFVLVDVAAVVGSVYLEIFRRHLSKWKRPI